MSKKILIIALSFIAALLGGCATQYELYSSNNLGVSVEFPKNWVIIEDELTIKAASSDDAAASGDLGTGAGLSLTPTTIDNFEGETDPKKLLSVFENIFQSSGAEFTTLEPVTRRTINEQAAASVKYEGTLNNEAGIYSATVIVKDEIVVLVMAVDGSKNGSFAGTIQYIVNSVTIDY